MKLKLEPMKTFKFQLFLLLIITFISLSQYSLLDQKKSHLSAIEEARQYMNAGLFQKAQWFLEDQIRTASAFEHKEELLFLLTQCFIEQKKYEDAYQTSEEIFREKVSGVRLIYSMYYHGISAYHTGRYKFGLKSLQDLISKDQTNLIKGEAYYWKAACEYELGNLTNAEIDITNAYNTFKESENIIGVLRIGKDNILFLWAKIYDDSKYYNQAIEKLENLLIEYPKSLLIDETKIRLASFYIKIKHYGSAIEHLNSANPSNPKQRNEWLFLFAEAEYSIGSYKNAQSRYKEIIKKYPYGIFTRKSKYGLSWSFLKDKNYPEAIKEFKELINETDTISQNSLYQIGILSLLLNNTADAINAFEQLVERFPYNEYADNAYYQMGMIRYRAKQYAEARRNLQVAARLYPDSEIRAEAYRMLGEASFAVGDINYARYAFSQVQKLPSHDTLRAAAIFQEGIALYHLGRFNSSADKFSEFIKIYPKHTLIAYVYFWRGEAFYQGSKFDDAEFNYSTAISLMDSKHTKKSEAMYGLSWSLFEQKKFRQAINAFDKFIIENPKSNKTIEANLRKADCYFFLREYDKAAQLYNSLSESKKDSRLAEYAAFQLGLSFIQRGDISRGVDHLRRFLVQYPSSIYLEVAQFNIAWAYFSEEKFSKAIDEFNIFEDKHPQSQLMPRVLLNKGDAFYNISSYDSARIYYERLIAEYPTSLLRPDAINGLQFTYQAQGRSADAVAAIDAIISKQSNESGTDELLLRKGDILFGQGNFAQAAIEYMRILEMQPGPAVKVKALFQLGRSFEFENNIKKSIEYFERVYNEFPESEQAPSAILSVGYLYLKQKQWQNAISEFGKIESSYPNSPLTSEVQYNIGTALLNLKENDKARLQFDKLISKAPINDIFTNRGRLQIARMLQTKKQYNAAIDTLVIVVTHLSDDIAAEAYLLMGENYLALKKPANSLEAFAQVIEAFTHYPVLVERAWLGTGECYERLKNISKAREAYNQIISNPVDPSVKKDAEERLRRLKR